MKAFDRTAGHWLFWWSAVYLISAFTVNKDYVIIVQTLWLSIIALPLVCNPLARWLNMKETHMFNWFKKPAKDNVVKFPEPKETPKMPYVAPPEPEKPAKIFYRLGVTDNNRVAFSMGMSEITMTKLGCEQLIEQIEVFMNQLHEEPHEEK